MSMPDSSSIHVERHLPRKALLIGLTGAAGVTSLVIYAARYGWNALPIPLQTLAVLLLLMTLGQLPTMLSYLFGPRQFVLDDQALVTPTQSYPYAQMTGVACHPGAQVTRISLVQGRQLLLRWDIWGNPEDWNARLLNCTFPSLYSQAKAALDRGEKVEFGKGVALDRHTLHLPKGSLPLNTIGEIRISDENDSGARVRTLHVATAHARLSVDESRLRNQHVLFALLEELLPPPGNQR